MSLEKREPKIEILEKGNEFEIEKGKFEQVSREIERKYPEVKEYKKEIEEMKKETEKAKRDYPDLIKELDERAKRAGLKGVLVTEELEGQLSGMVALSYGSHYFLEKLEIISNLSKIKKFLPDIFEKTLDTIFGNKEKNIRGHEIEHLRGGALVLSSKLLEKRLDCVRREKEIEKIKKAKRITKREQKLLKEISDLAKEADLWDGIVEAQTEIQRLLNNSFVGKKEIEETLKKPLKDSLLRKEISEIGKREIKKAIEKEPSLREEIIKKIAENIVILQLCYEGIEKGLKMGPLDKKEWRRWFLKVYSFLDRKSQMEAIKKAKEMKEEIKKKLPKNLEK